jgi:urease accessory protein
MRKISKRISPPARLAPRLVARAPALTLGYDERCKSRLAATLDNGEPVALLLPHGTRLADGDVLVADDGGLVRVAAAAQSVLRAHAATPLLLMRAAYHLGNRHTPVEIGADYLLLEADPVLGQMLTRLGLVVEAATQPFQPEPGAYGGGHRHGHDDTFADDYALAQQVFDDHHGHEHDAVHEHEHGHDHDHGQCTHDHTHNRAHDHSHDAASAADHTSPASTAAAAASHGHAHR